MADLQNHLHKENCQESAAHLVLSSPSAEPCSLCQTPTLTVDTRLPDLITSQSLSLVQSGRSPVQAMSHLSIAGRVGSASGASEASSARVRPEFCLLHRSAFVIWWLEADLCAAAMPIQWQHLVLHLISTAVAVQLPPLLQSRKGTLDLLLRTHFKNRLDTIIGGCVPTLSDIMELSSFVSNRD